MLIRLTVTWVIFDIISCTFLSRTLFSGVKMGHVWCLNAGNKVYTHESSAVSDSFSEREDKRGTSHMWKAANQTVGGMWEHLSAVDGPTILNKDSVIQQHQRLC